MLISNDCLVSVEIPCHSLHPKKEMLSIPYRTAQTWDICRRFCECLFVNVVGLSKAFDCLNHELLIAKLNAYDFSRSALLFIHSYLTDKKQGVKVNGSFSTWTETVLGVTQGSVSGSLLFNIYLNDRFFVLT